MFDPRVPCLVRTIRLKDMECVCLGWCWSCLAHVPPRDDWVNAMSPHPADTQYVAVVGDRSPVARLLDLRQDAFVFSYSAPPMTVSRNAW
jgi:hypothetical protein